MVNKSFKVDENLNRDPITDEPGAHPVGTGLGAVAGASLGAAIGTAAAGPLGTITGAVAGTIVGGLSGAVAGKNIAEVVNPTEINMYWNENYSSRPYVNANQEYETFRPAYQFGYDARVKNPERKFDEIEADLHSEWKGSNKSSLEWDNAKDAVRDSYDHTDRLYKERTKKA